MMVAHFREVRTVYHNNIQLRLYAVKPCQSLRVIAYQIDLAIPLLSVKFTYLLITHSFNIPYETSTVDEAEKCM